ncbi:dihydrodipicolinate synthase family protein [Pseudalkalibacillus decolorationis]|uniref:dihydrodipicolinate synthase family protein n=1 Tax=Pseudalkalibacillus decolorationis TaxID=163879 RepID=UPI002148351E|nr:dihydrodipicolinate synthase family protein [Pseudalkalibacillus decolorationis]
MLDPAINKTLQEGVVIPAHPLALNTKRKLDEVRQRSLTRYYITSGAGGVAVGVHTTQFEIREKKYNLYREVLELASEEVQKAELTRPFIKIAGICGSTSQAIKEAYLAKELGYDLGLVSMGGLDDWSEEELLIRLEEIVKIIPIFGFYLQPSVGGRKLSYDFWRKTADIPGVVAIKIAPFNRYQTLDVVRAVCESERRDDIALYTGNDDNIIVDLLTTYRFVINEKIIEKKMVGGLLGQWAVWTKKAVELLEELKKFQENKETSLTFQELLKRNIEMTDVNAAFFDVNNQFAGCISGIHEVLRRQGLLEGRWCLNPIETLSKGQIEEIDRVYKQYPHLNDDGFVKQNLSAWMKGNEAF